MSIVVSIPACHAGDLGSSPSLRTFYFDLTDHDRFCWDFNLQGNAFFLDPIT